MEFSGRVLVHKDAVCVADLHIGFEKALEEEGYNLPSQTGRMLDELTEYKGKLLVIVGDVKHSIPRASDKELREIPIFLGTLKEKFHRVVICKGNHDGRIERLTDVEVVKDFIYDGIGFTHGHRWPGEKVFGCETIVIAHSHPVFSYKDHLGRLNRNQCWVVGKMNNRKIMAEKGTKSQVKRVIVMPAFNKVFFGRSKDEFGVLSGFVKKTDVFLTDGTKVL